MTLEELRKLIDGYVTDGFSRYINPNDADAASEQPCAECGNGGVYGVGVKKGHDYHAWAVCGDCGECFEF